MMHYPHLEKNMRIDAPKGTKVKYAFPQNGYPHDQTHTPPISVNIISML